MLPVSEAGLYALMTVEAMDFLTDELAIVRSAGLIPDPPNRLTRRVSVRL